MKNAVTLTLNSQSFWLFLGGVAELHLFGKSLECRASQLPNPARVLIAPGGMRTEPERCNSHNSQAANCDCLSRSKAVGVPVGGDDFEYAGRAPQNCDYFSSPKRSGSQ